METLIVLNYSISTVDIYTIETDTDITRDFIRQLGHNPDECSWMFAGEIMITFHSNIINK